jgi:hypothetical protein
VGVFVRWGGGGGGGRGGGGGGGGGGAHLPHSNSSTMVYDAVSEDSSVPKFRIEENRVTFLCRLIPWTQR